MSAALVIGPTATGLRAAYVVDGLLSEVHDVDEAGLKIADRFFSARVSAVEPKLDAAFLDLGAAGEGFLTAKDAWPWKRDVAPRPGKKRPPIGKLAQAGERVLAQGLREAGDDKGARLTTDLKLFGFGLIYRPRGDDLAASRRTSRREQQLALERAQRLFPEGGVTLRANASAFSDDDLVAERDRLRARFRAIEASAKDGKTGPVPDGRDLLDRLIDVAYQEDVTRLHLSEPALREAAKKRLEGAWRPLGWRLEREQGCVFAATGVAEALEDALSKEAPLEGGGRLIIEETAACVAIDVDGGGRAPIDVNLDAAAEIIRQLRLRNLGGPVVVDFVDMADNNQRKRVQDALTRAAKRDPARPEIHPIGPLGMAMINRAKRGEPLARRLTRRCPLCDGEGFLSSLAERVDALGRALDAAGVGRHRALLAADLHDYATGDGAAAFARARARLRGDLVVERGDGLAPGAFEVVRA